MFSHWQMLTKYIRYYIHAANGKGHGTHSPFVYEFITKLLNDGHHYPEYDRVEQLRNSLRDDSTQLTIEDLGAGSVTGATKQRSISSIAKTAVKPKKYSQLLFRMSRFYRPANIIELGTSLGISSAYMALGNPDAKIITMEGAASVAGLASKNFEKLDIRNIELVQGNFDQVLGETLKKVPQVDLAFIDGNHRQEPTERYFLEFLPHCHNDTILVFDDIHWSSEMEAAWATICNHPSVRCSIDLFFIGIISFRREFVEKQGFTIRF